VIIKDSFLKAALILSSIFGVQISPFSWLLLSYLSGSTTIYQFGLRGIRLQKIKSCKK
jgi:hypothetical protein